ncbi:hypothetical protein HBI23_049720 [Parastagonospora nodorum]|nr:hypothetical protein HBI71_016550 [Parastagonospora nodorum]KAH5336192.1 hypothetical protein HBI12_028950 [Parastagonospora nodorum]KAH5686035.1 hypothetical protein HBI23_049720 [Parastagonospora nodorum]
MVPSEAKKRKACDACTKAKAKCSPSDSRAKVCQRCERLGKECAYGASLRKRGPRTRSRMNQLEQRVETLMGMLSASGADPELLNQARAAAPTDPASNSPDSDTSPPLEDTPGASSSEAFADTFNTNSAGLVDEENKFTAYDPVDAGILQGSEATELLDEFRRDYTDCFPFVVVGPALDVDTLRQEQPFLFLSIMSIMAYRTPSIQRALGEAFRRQIGTRIVGSSHKGLEMLQGLLLYSAYYHYYYRPRQQQLVLMTQMCVALAQELRLSVKAKSRGFSDAPSVLTNAENRAMLGTFYIAAAFAQAWRKRTTVPYTRALARACQDFSQRPEFDSDLLITPLVQSSELMCRINDCFSYDEIEDSDINGETLLKLSTNNFSAEIQRLRDAIPESIRGNNTVRLGFDMLNVMVYECSIHSTLWRNSPSDRSSTMTHARIIMLQRSLLASQNFARSLLATPTSSLNGLNCTTWGGWFYSTVLVLKIIVLQRFGETDSARVNSVPHTVGDLLPQDHGGSTTRRISSMTSSLELSTLKENITSLEEWELVTLLESFIQKVEAAATQYVEEDRPVTQKPYFMKVATLQTALLDEIKKMACFRPDDVHIQQPEYDIPTSGYSGGVSQGYEHQQTLSGQFQDPGSMDPDAAFGFGNPNNMAAFGFQQGQQPPVDDWLWNMVLNDVNMFTM